MSTFYPIGGSNVGDLDLVTAEGDDVLEGKVIVDKDGNPLTGKMPNQGAIKQTLGINDSYSIPRGFHSGYGKVSQSLPTLDARTYTPGRSDQVIEANIWLKGEQIIKGDADLIAANIKKGVSIFGITGTFEGWVPVATDLYYNGANANGFTIYGAYARLENNRIYFIKTSSASPINSTYKDPDNDYGAFLRFGKTVDVRSYTKMIFEGSFYGSTSAGKSNFAIFDSSGTIRYKESDESGNIVPQKQIVIDITQSSYINAGSYMKFGGRDGGYITRIRLE